MTLIIDGREVTATEGEMLHDAAKRGDVEIPVFCYEPKLGEPVGACRMCLVEVEGIPKLQTSCSTPVRDGMVVHTRTEQVKEAQSAVVEFLLVNHPLDCPVCDKGGECPLQDITMGWGPGKSRLTDDKRHFEKPIELSPLVAIDRERCILCYRCVRFSQEVAEDEQLQLLERGDRTFVGTFDDRPYVAPFHGNITDLCPVGALTSYTYRFRARPWDIEQAGSVCTLCPSQCNVSFTVRDEQVKRVVARDNPDVDDGWLCDRGRYGFEMFGAEERVDGPRWARRRADWPEAIAKAAAGLQGRRRGERRDRRRRLQRGGLPGPADHARGARLAERRLAGLARSRPRARCCSSPSPRSQPRVRDIDDADAVLVVGTDPLHSSPILDLRIRKAHTPQRHPPGGGDRPPDPARRRRRGGRPLRPRRAPRLPLRAGARAARRRRERGRHRRGGRRCCASAGKRRDRLGRADRPRGRRRRRACSMSPPPSTSQSKDGSGPARSPRAANARGLREAGCLPDAGPGLIRVLHWRSSRKRDAGRGKGDRGDPRGAGSRAS